MIGLIFGVGSVGALIGAFLVRRAVDLLGVGPAVIASIALAGAANFLVPLATRSTGLIMLFGAMFFTGFGSVIYNSNQVGLRQAITPTHMQGKMNATMRFMVWGTIPIGSFVGGVLGKTVGIRPTLWIGAIGGMLAVVPLILSPVRSLERIPEDEHPEGVADALAAATADQIAGPA